MTDDMVEMAVRMRGIQNFARCPADALQCLADIHATTDIIQERARTSPEVRNAIKDTTLGYIVDLQKSHSWSYMLRDVPVYFWSEKTTTLVAQASKTYPIDTNEILNEARVKADKELVKKGIKTNPPTSLPSLGAGLAVFERPVLYININGVDRPLSALMWRVGIWAEQKEISLLIRGIEWFGSWAAPCFWVDAPLGNNAVTDLPTDPKNTINTEKVDLTKWICTASMFVQQNILASTETRVGKHVARRVPQHVPTCHVISLRKEIHQGHQNQEGESDIEWACRWLVRGHWRNQYFPSSNTRAPIWIHPHVKGPEDKPFRNLPTVHAVTK